MQIKRYEAAGIQEAMAKIRKDLGQNAVVLSTKRVRRGKVVLIEVTAARDPEHSEAPSVSALAGKTGGEAALPLLSASGAEEKRGNQDLKNEIDEIKKMLADFKKENSIRADLIELKETVNTLFDLFGLVKNERGCFSTIYHHLLARGISRERAYKIMDQARNHFNDLDQGNNRGDIWKGIEDLVKRGLVASEKRATEKKALAFIGPTGVGKTTTLAKLAAHYALEEKKKVGLIAMDTYRIAAAEQLKVYAKIMGIPIEVAPEKEAFKRALNKFSDMDQILIDTPGKNQADRTYLQTLSEILDQTESVNACLLLSLTSSRENMLDAAVKFSSIPYDSIIFTKIDECTSCGVIYDVMEQMHKPVPYITNGQNVPKDIIKVTPGKIAKLIMGNQLN